MPLTDAALAALVRGALSGPETPARLGVAVSGGGDSTALLVLLADWARHGGPALAAVTVDHGLRAAAADEARAVARLCADLGLPHRTLCWQDRDGRGNLMAAARQARLRLIADWARAEGIGAVALAHTAEDQAETVLMRLARGSGVDGLSGMAARRRADGVSWHRPLLSAGRDDLRAFLRARGIAWAEDPSNADPRFDRVRARQALATLAPLGIGRDRLVETAAVMALARDALETAALRAARAIARAGPEGVTLNRDGLAAEPEETRLRLLAHAIRFVTGGPYRPRLAALRQAEAAALAGRRHTLAGCLLAPLPGAIGIWREPRAAAEASRAAPGAVWDGRFVLLPPDAAAAIGAEVRVLGPAGLALCPNWRAEGLARPAAVGLPGVWRGGALLAAPLAGRAEGWQALPVRPPDCFFSSLVTH